MAKTENHSVRFDEDKLAFFKEKNPTLITVQKVVDYFLDEFWWKHHGKWVHKIDVEELPTTGRQFFQEQTVKGDTPNVELVEKTFQQHMNDLPDLETEYDYRNKAGEIEAATNITRKQKDLLLTNMRQSKL